MEVILGKSPAPPISLSLPSFVICGIPKTSKVYAPEVLFLSYLSTKENRLRVCCSLSYKEQVENEFVSASSLNVTKNCGSFLQPYFCGNRKFISKYRFFSLKHESVPGIRKLSVNLQKAVLHAERSKALLPAFFIRLIVGVMLLTILGSTAPKVPSWALSEENLLFLEAWRILDRAYVDKTFNGQTWFRYRENALRSEPMSTREETYAAIRKMVATLNDPFTRFLEPQKFKSLRSGTRNTLTGVGISIGYPAGKDKLSGLVVVSAAPGGPANRAGISSGDGILAIDGTDTKGMEVYEAAERLQVHSEQGTRNFNIFGKLNLKPQTSRSRIDLTSLGCSIADERVLACLTGPGARWKGSEGSTVELIIHHGPEIRKLSLVRERVLLNPVKSRICKPSGLRDDGPLIGYIKLISFNQNASGAVREAIETLREKNVKAFILDLRDNSGGLFPEGIEVAKIWLDKGVIVYICDNRGVRDIYETDGSNAAVSSEPLAILVNKGTASASEILAGALKDNKRAIVFGEPTYGKGKIQSVFQLSDGSGLVVTVARYETPAHIDIDKIGIIPDHPLPTSFPKDEDSFCSCLQDPASACYLNNVGLFSR